MVAVFGENARVFARIVAFVLPLGLDTLAIAVALGLRGQRPLRPALLFVVFETTMPLIGIVIGRVVGLWFEAGAAYLGGLILLAVGLHMLQEARFRQDAAQGIGLDSRRAIVLAGLGISMDEIAIGFPLGGASPSDRRCAWRNRHPDISRHRGRNTDRSENRPKARRAGFTLGWNCSWRRVSFAWRLGDFWAFIFPIRPPVEARLLGSMGWLPR